jgi:23S rRNA (adenine-N6)-dimethyltransferase
VAVRQRPARGAPGQHFLRSSRLASELVRAAEIAHSDLVVDIGAGTGVLTRALLEVGARVIAVELDPALANALRRRFAAPSRVAVLEVDARRWELPTDEFSVVANLPFAGSGEILNRLLRDPHTPLRRADVIVQWGFAAKQARIWPATLKGTYWRTWYELAITDRLSRTAFSPSPEVDAAVLRITPRLYPPVDRAEYDSYRRFLSVAFRTQKPIGRALRLELTPLEVRRLADTLGFSPSARPHDLDVRQWAGVFAHARGRRTTRR